MIAGIVCEYNPFHNGHLYHIEKTKALGADYIVAVMSGNFVQRGECAVTDKWLRAEAAVKCGADVVIDLPVPWSCGSAESFARGSIGLLSHFGIDALSFGSESDDVEVLINAARAAADEEVGKLLKKKMAQGMSYPVALCESAGELYGEEVKEILSCPNSTLAVEYIKALSELSPGTKIMPVKRKGSGHDSDVTVDSFASASKIRGMENRELWKEYMPDKALELFGKADIYRMKNAERAILSSLREMKKEEYGLYITDSTGLVSRIYEGVKEAAGLDELYERVKSKNYTHSRIRREILNLYLKIPKELSAEKPPYMRILAVNERGLSLLCGAKENSSVPIVTRHGEMLSLTEKGKQVYELQCTSSDKYGLFTHKVQPCSREQKNSMIIVK